MPRMKGQGNARSWPQDHIDTLERLWRDGKTAGQIADELPYSRSAVLGQVHRRGLPSRPRVCVPKIPKPPKPAKPKPFVLVRNTGSRRERAELLIDLVADRGQPVREAAGMANVDMV